MLLQNARLAQRRGQLVSARSLCLAVAALPPETVPKGLCLEALEMAEPMAYVSGDLEEGRAIRSRIGQLLEPSGPCHADPYRPWRMELGADPAALKRWQAIRTLPARSRLEALTPSLQEHPQATALAFGLLHTLHEAGMTGSEKLMEDAGAPIHRRLWLLQRHSGSSLEQETRARRWRALHPGWDCAWLNPGREAIARQEDLAVLVIAACRAVNAAEVRAGLLRLAVLWQHGGLAVG